jgi:hypothetical protein
METQDEKTRGSLTSRWIGPGVQGVFGQVVVCSGWVRGGPVRGPGRSPHKGRGTSQLEDVRLL